MLEAARFNLVQLRIQPSEIDRMTFTQYLTIMIAQYELNGKSLQEPVTAREAQRRIRSRR